jgi:hypothetical protein
MHHHALTRMGAPAVLFLSTAIPALAQDSTVTGARVKVVDRAAGTLSITLHNLRESPLVAWELAVVRPRTPPVTGISDFIRPFAYPSDSGPVTQGEPRQVRVQTADSAADADVVVQLAVFADGYCQGQRAAFERLRAARAREAESVRVRLAALQQMPPTSDDEALAAQMREHLTRLEQPVTPAPEWLNGNVDTVLVSRPGVPQARHYTVVENLRDVPIEAFGVRYGSGTIARFFLFSASADQSGGPIQPRATREVPVSIGHGDNPDPPEVSVAFVMFADGAFEGSSTERKSVVQFLQRRSADMTFAIAVLSDALQQPAERIADFLESQTRERAAALAAAREHPSPSGEIERVIRRARSAPNEAPGYAAEVIAQLEATRARLARHLPH